VYWGSVGLKKLASEDQKWFESVRTSCMDGELGKKNGPTAIRVHIIMVPACFFRKSA